MMTTSHADSMRGSFVRALMCAALIALACVPAAFAHGVASADYKTTITSVTPKGLPIDVQVVAGDQLRVENDGSKELIVCGYGMPGDGGCEQFARINSKRVDVNHNSRTYYANLDTTNYGTVPKDVGKAGPQWVRAQNVNFLAFHDHRTHWMGGKTLPGGVDSSNPKAQFVFDWKVNLKYGDKLVTVKGKLDYVGGKTWFQRYGEVLITVFAVLAMLIVFGFDARRRRKLRVAKEPAVSAGGADVPATVGGATVLAPEVTKKDKK